MNKNNGENYRLLLAFGSNMGNREENLNRALEYVSRSAKLVQSSLWHKTQPLKSSCYNTSDQDYYINFVVEVVTEFNPYDFYKNIIVQIEDILGHSRQSKWMSRALDIDVVFAAKNDAVLFTNCTPVTLARENFFVPHCEYNNRDFWQTMIEGEIHYVPKR